MTTSGSSLSLDALLPAEMAAKAEQIGMRKAAMNSASTFVLAVLAGAFIALGAVFATTVTAGTVDVLPWGLMRLLAGTVFSLGLVLVVVGGAELFTGNALIIMAWDTGKVSTRTLLRNWLIVYTGNFVGALGTVGLVFLSGQYRFANGAVGAVALATAAGKLEYGFVQALALGILCNALVCLAVWLTLSARSTTDKIVAIMLPITAFVAAGFEHSVANMYFVPIALFIRELAPPEFWTGIGRTAGDYAGLTWGNFLLRNLLPVTIGNIIGGAVLVGAVYGLVYIRLRGRDAERHAEATSASARHSPTPPHSAPAAVQAMAAVPPSAQTPPPSPPQVPGHG
jgi:formate transporter